MRASPDGSDSERSLSLFRYDYPLVPNYDQSNIYTLKKMIGTGAL